MKTFRLVALLVFTGVSIFVSAVVGWRLTEPIKPLAVRMPAELLPGNPLPAGAVCQWVPPYSYVERYCWLGDVYFVYDMELDEITHSSLYIYSDDVTVGELVVAWGSPSGYSREAAFTNVYWANRTVYVIGRQFGPNNRVVLVAWVLSTEISTPWKGWRQSDN